MDGSGDVNDPRLRRCGWAFCSLVWVQGEYQLEGVFFPHLGAERHTVARAELRALIEVVRATVGDIVAYSDASYVVNGFNGSRHKHPTGSNFDLWVELGIVLSSHDGHVIALKIESHASVAQIIMSGLSAQHYLGNALADTFAKRGADLVSLPKGYLAHPDAVAKHVQHRIATTLQIALSIHSGTSDPVPRTATSRKQERLAELQASLADGSVQHNLA